MGEPSGLVDTPVNPLWLGLAYLLGSIPFGFLIGRWRAVDVQKEGSGNIGATNVARTAGKLWGVITLILDAGKGALAVWLARDMGDPATAMMAGAGVLGHVAPVWLRFRGGKGVATTAGALAVLDPSLLGLTLLVFVAVMVLVRTVGISSMAAAIALPVIAWSTERPIGVRWAVLLIGVLILVRHRGNVQRFLAERRND